MSMLSGPISLEMLSGCCSNGAKVSIKALNVILSSHNIGSGRQERHQKTTIKGDR
jgi:hypothetical protein